MWWAIVTFSTVGYGDLIPTTGWGRFAGALTVVSGMLLMTLLMTIVSSNFSEELARHTACLDEGGDGFELSVAAFRSRKSAAAIAAETAEELRGEIAELRASVGALLRAQGIEPPTVQPRGNRGMAALLCVNACASAKGGQVGAPMPPPNFRRPPL